MLRVNSLIHIIEEKLSTLSIRVHAGRVGDNTKRAPSEVGVESSSSYMLRAPDMLLLRKKRKTVTQNAHGYRQAK
jgi:hypothetical protein